MTTELLALGDDLDFAFEFREGSPGPWLQPGENLATAAVAASGAVQVHTSSISGDNVVFWVRPAPGAAVGQSGKVSCQVTTTSTPPRTKTVFMAFVISNTAALVTLVQVKQYLDMALAIQLPDFMLQAGIDKIAPTVPALEAAGYADADQILIQCMTASLIAAAGAPKRLSSQGAPSGASRSFRVSDKDLTALRRSLAALDTAGVMSKLVGPDPAGSTLFMVV